MLPSAERIVFPNSSFFAQNGASASLPSPSAVRAAGAHVPGGSEYPRVRPLAVPFDSMNVMVKYGREITISEGQCLWAIGNKLGHRLPVPEVYGWCRDGNEVFIYMELIRGDTLHSRWTGLSRQEKEDISTQLRQMVGALREFKLGPSGAPIGRIDGQPILDVVFTDSFTTPAGTFPNMRSFHDWFTRLPSIKVGRPSTDPHPMRADLPDDIPIVFTHGDLNRGNIMISPKGNQPARIVAIIDWHQSGWMPVYWEYCKASWCTRAGDEWRDHYLPRIFHPYDQYHPAWEYIRLSLGL